MMKLPSYWYRHRLHPLLLPLLPFSLAFGLVTGVRRWAYRLGLRKVQAFTIPVIVVGNISVGGTGKTPLVSTLARAFKAQGKKPGIALRGIGGKKIKQPLLVAADANPLLVGDEAVLLAQTTDCPVTACTDRPAAVKALQEAGCDLVLCDDGLQHYRLARKLEIAIIDGSRHFGNGLLLPAGPLREPVSRLKTVDFLVLHGDQDNPTPRCPRKPDFYMRLQPEAFHSIHAPEKIRTLSAFRGQKVHAIAGIGNPQRFFDQLSALQIEVIPHPFPDHHRYQISDLQFSDQLPILMTEKDAVKCKLLPFDLQTKERQWFLRVNAEVKPELKQAILDKIEEK